MLEGSQKHVVLLGVTGDIRVTEQLQNYSRV